MLGELHYIVNDTTNYYFNVVYKKNENCKTANHIWKSKFNCWTQSWKIRVKCPKKFFTCTSHLHNNIEIVPIDH